MFVYMYSHVRLIWSYVCEFRCGSICVHPFTHGIVCMLYMYVCMHMYVSIHNFLSVHERYM